MPQLAWLSFVSLDGCMAISEFSTKEAMSFMIKKPYYALIVLILCAFQGLNAQSSEKIILGGSGYVVGEDIQHPNGNIFDQVLLTGQAIRLRAKSGNITRVSFMDENEDIVQVEFSGAGIFTVLLDPDTFLPPLLPPRYNQNTRYVTGKPRVVIEGANSTTFLSIFTVGKINAVNQALFPEGQVYDAQADVTLVEVVNSTGMGGMHLANVAFSGSTGKVGVTARGVPIAVRLVIGDIEASGSAEPYLLFGENSFTVITPNSGLRIAGGNLYQPNGASITGKVAIDDIIFQDNVRSDGSQIKAGVMRGDFLSPSPSIVQSFVPQSLNDKAYIYALESDDGLEPMLIYFKGHNQRRTGNFDRLKGGYLGDVFITGVVSGTYTSEVDAENQNMLHIDMVARDAILFSDDTLVEVRTIYEMAAILQTPVTALLYLEMEFITHVIGLYSVTVVNTAGNVRSESGVFSLIEDEL